MKQTKMKTQAPAPKLPGGMRRRIYKGRIYYYARLQRHGQREQCVALGTDLQLALRKFADVQRRWLDDSPEPTSVASVAQLWLENRVKLQRPTGYRQASHRVRRYLVPTLGQVLIHQLTADHIRQYRMWLEQQHVRRGLWRRERPELLKPQTIVHILGDLRCMLIWAVECGYIGASPMPRRVMPRVQEQSPKRLTDAQCEVLLRLPEPFRYAIRLALGTGMRWGELCRARAEDVQVVDGRRFLVIQHRTKSRRIRRVPIARELVAGKVGLLVGPMRPSVFARSVERRLCKIGYGGLEPFHFTPHMLRHTYATKFIEAGGQASVLQALLGHQDLKTTQRYVQLSANAIWEDAQRVGLV